MAGKNEDKKGSNETYQYPDEEYVSAEQAAATEEPEQEQAEVESEEQVTEDKLQALRDNPIMRAIKNNQRVSFVIGVVVIALIGFKLFGSHHSAQLAEQQRAAEAQQQSVKQAVEQAKQVNPKVSSALASIKQAERSDHNTIVGMQTQLKDLRSALDQTTAAQSQLSQAVSALADQVKQLNDKMTAHPKAVATSSDKAKQAAPAKPVVYHVKAMVEGRAWIVSSNGLSESVSVGDTIPNYGTVKAVDANRGVVVTSSGKVIQYGKNDR